MPVGKRVLHRAFRLDVVAAYNRQDLPLRDRRSPRVVQGEDIAAQPYIWAKLSMRDTEDLLMDLYIARRRHMQ